MPRGLPPGIRRTPSGFQAYCEIHGTCRSKRFPRDTTVSAMRAWRQETIGRLHAQGPRARRGTFPQDIVRYLEAVRTMPTYWERAGHLAAWSTVFGQRRRETIQPSEIRAALERWRQQGYEIRDSQGRLRRQAAAYAASSLNHRRTALMHVWSVLDGSHAANPVRDVPRYREPAPVARALPAAMIVQALASMPDTATRARLAVMAWTGIPHRLLMQVTRDDLDMAGATVWVQGREKGRGTVGRMLPLCPPAVEAFKAFDRHEAYGDFSSSAARQSWLRALTRCGLPLTSRPYDLRHSWGTLVYQLTGDLPATQALLGHADPRTTLRYTVAGVAPRVLEVMKTVGPVVSEVQIRVPNPATNPATIGNHKDIE